MYITVPGKGSVLRPAALIVSVVLIASSAACQKAPPSTEPSIRGVVTSVERAETGIQMRVVWTNDATVGQMAEYDAAQISTDSKTDFFDRPGGNGEAQPLDAMELAVGDVVEVWFSGPVAESYPVQAGASDVVRTGRYDGQPPAPPGLDAP
jgi:beta-N-acetylhexosaminidase